MEYFSSIVLVFALFYVIIIAIYEFRVIKKKERSEENLGISKPKRYSAYARRNEYKIKTGLKSQLDELKKLHQ